MLLGLRSLFEGGVVPPPTPVQLEGAGKPKRRDLFKDEREREENEELEFILVVADFLTRIDE